MTRCNVIIYFFALLFVGLGYLSSQPVFEGFDEDAHYSSIRQIADTGIIPTFGASFLDQSTTQYQGPVHYGSYLPPFDDHMVYKKFFAHNQLVTNYTRLYRQANIKFIYQKSNQINWEAQHPPLYYLIFAQLSKIISSYSLVVQIFILRLCSYILALAGVALALLAFKKYKFAFLGFIVYPIVLPMFFPEFTRIGNDSLCLFLVGLLTLLISLWHSHSYQNRYTFLMGIVLGVGLLVKNLFIPILAGLITFLLIKSWYASYYKQKLPSIYVTFVNIILLPIAMGGSWYFYQYFYTGHIITSADTASLAQHGGWLANIQLTKNLLIKLIKGVLSPAKTYIWAGSWSLVRLNTLLFFPMVILFIWLLIPFFKKLRSTAVTNIIWLPVFVMGYFIAALVIHVIISLALLGVGNTPGWYMHILMPWIACLLGMGVHDILNNKKSKILLAIFFIYAFLFQLIAIWSQLALYAGCASKNIDKYYLFSGDYFCLDQIPLLFDHLAILGWPIVTIIGFGIGFILFFILFIKIWSYKDMGASERI